MKVHLLFEQSGVFKNEFKKLGYDAYDYDIKDDFGETDYKINLFSEILRGGQGEESIFDDITSDDLIMAFFPCIRFENQIMLSFRGQAHQMKKWTDVQKMKYCLKLQKELTEMYELVNHLFIICIENNLKLIMENPYSEEHYLRRYWCIPPALVDKDRRRGDYFCKPTQYWFINIEPKHNFLLDPQIDNAINVKDAIRKMSKEEMNSCGLPNDRRVARSMIHPDYANRFIREFILE